MCLWDLGSWRRGKLNMIFFCLRKRSRGMNKVEKKIKWEGVGGVRGF